MEGWGGEAGWQFVVAEVDDIDESVDCIAFIVFQSDDKLAVVLVVAVC